MYSAYFGVQKEIISDGWLAGFPRYLHFLKVLMVRKKPQTFYYWSSGCSARKNSSFVSIWRPRYHLEIMCSYQETIFGYSVFNY